MVIMEVFMKSLIYLLLVLFSHDLWAQEDQLETPEEGFDQTLENEGTLKPKSETPSVKVECTCPRIEQEYSQELPGPVSYFPENSVFIIAPWPSTPELPSQEKKREMIPGYIEKLESGYSDESYKQIP
jgi:hypothetical protein